MSESSTRPIDDLKLKQNIKLLCTTRIRQPLTMERIKTWLNQFDAGPQQTLALLILRHLIYRTSGQIEAALEQALRRASLHFVSTLSDKEDLNWREILANKVDQLNFFFGPPAHRDTRPGKSGELISRALTSHFGIAPGQLSYPENFTVLDIDERYLLVDDGTFTGEQLIEFIEQSGRFMNVPGQSGIVVAMAHDKALATLNARFPNIPVFFGERITEQDGLQSLSKKWIEKDNWPYREITPYDLYLEIVQTKGNFSTNAPIGFGGMGLLVAYEHGIPDDSLPLLWNKSNTWNPLFNR